MDQKHNSKDVQSSLVVYWLFNLLLPKPSTGRLWYQSKHKSSIISSNAAKTSIRHQIDTTYYIVSFSHSSATASNQGLHYFTITPSATNNSFEFSCRFALKVNTSATALFTETKESCLKGWKEFWTGGAAVDFSGSTDKRAFELERRIILSPYLIKIQETGSNPPQETGLTYNSWFGKPHMEMPYWHLSHYPFREHNGLLDKNMDWYFKAADKGRAIAKRQGFDGIRWQKMTDNNGDETASSVGAFLI